MKNRFGSAQKNIKMRHIPDTWMCWDPGADELKTCDQGRLKPKSFSQETENEGQHQPRIGSRPTKERSAGRTTSLDSFPSLFFSFSKINLRKKSC